MVIGLGALAGITAATQLGSSVIGGLFNKKSQESQNKSNIDAWNMQNAYNNPAAQMERLKSAGLNPNLVYSGNAVGNSSSDLVLQGTGGTVGSSVAQGVGDAVDKTFQNYYKTLNAENKEKVAEIAEGNLKNNVEKTKLEALKIKVQREKNIAYLNELLRHNTTVETETGRHNLVTERNQELGTVVGGIKGFISGYKDRVFGLEDIVDKNKLKLVSTFPWSK